MRKSAEKSYFKGNVEELVSYIDTAQMVLAYQQPRRNARLYAYSDILGSACSECFRWCDGQIHIFDGRVWHPCALEEFKYIVRDALVLSSGVGCEVVKGDWVDKDKKILEYALDGVKSSPLRRSPWIVGFSNGVWDFSEVNHPVRHGFGERLAITHVLPYDYDPSATCPVWISFLSSMLPKCDIEVLQKFFGLSYVSREHNRVESSLWLIGAGANGKSTIESIMPLVFGQSCVSHTRLDTLLDRNIDARMRAMNTIVGRKFNICEEISGADIERGSDVFKSLVSGQPQQARGIGKDIYDATEIPFLVFTMNQLPKNKNMDDAFRRRMVRINFRTSVRREDMDTGLVDKLAGELSGIRNWVLEGYRKLVECNYEVAYGDVGLNDDDIDMMIRNGHTVDLWVRHVGIYPVRHVGHEQEEVSAIIPFSRMFSEYESYCVNNLQEEPVSRKQMGNDLGRLGYERKRSASGQCYKIYCDKRNSFINT